MKRRARGTGRVFRPTYGKAGDLRQAATLFIKYPCSGSCGQAACKGRHVEKTGFLADEPGSYAKAEKLLRKRLGEVDSGKLIGPAPTKLRLHEMIELARQDYQTNRRKSLDRLNYAIKHVEDYFGGATLALAITDDKLNEYVITRRKEKAKDATIHAELSAISKMFTVAIRTKKLTASARPGFPSLGKLHNARKGLFEYEEFQKVLGELSDDLQPLMEFLYWSGWRKREGLGLRWTDVDFMRGEMKLDGANTKNGLDRVFPFSELPPLRDLLYRQRQRTDAIEKKSGKKIEHVFHRNGKPIKDYYGAWRAACARAGLGRDRIVHDFRRGAVHRLEWAGVPREVAMKLTGHETDSIYGRYAIARNKDLRAGLGRVADYVEALGLGQARDKGARPSRKRRKAVSRK